MHSMHPRESSQHGVYMGWKAKGPKPATLCHICLPDGHGLVPSGIHIRGCLDRYLMSPSIGKDHAETDP